MAILRAGRLVHEQSIEQLRRSHRITARLTGTLSEIPAALKPHVRVASQHNGVVVLEAADSRAPLLGWLATLPLAEVRIDPVGLDAVYEAHHKTR